MSLAKYLGWEYGSLPNRKLILLISRKVRDMDTDGRRDEVLRKKVL